MIDASFLKSLPLSAIILIVLVWRFLRPRPPGDPLPGPRGLPYVGIAFKLPAYHPWQQLQAWHSEFGPIYGFKLFGLNFVSLGTVEAANILLRNRGNIYSDRHYIATLRDAIHLPAVAYGDCWRRQRKLFHYAQLNCTIANPIYLTTINENLRRALTEITTRPDSWHEILSGYISGVTSDLAFGTQVTAFDEYIPRFWAAAADIGEKNALPGVFIVNLFPWLRFFPPFRWHDRKRLEDEKHFIYERFYGVQEELEEAEKASISVPNQNLFERNELQQSKDSIRWSIARLYFQNKSRWSDMSDHEAAYTLAAFVMASLAGTPGTMKLVFWALMLFPEWQTRIYEEVRRVCGDRVVELKDKEFMPVTRAVMKEAVRWRPMGPGGFPHTLMEDDAYRGWRVPKGALVMWHHWTISRDSTAFPNPETFDPDRFLDPSSPAYQAPLTQHPTLTLDPGFGYGRRACPGVSQAEDMMLMFFGTFFRRFELRRRKGRDGREEEIHSYDYVEGRTTRPAWFGLEIVERGREE